MPKRITTDEWRAELHKILQPADDEGETAVEISDATGQSHTAVKRLIRKKLKAGELIQGMACRHGADGSRRRVPVYRPAP